VARQADALGARGHRALAGAGSRQLAGARRAREGRRLALVKRVQTDTGTWTRAGASAGTGTARLGAQVG
jgi:hypothetical protein